ncbi:hypothetical protein O181_078466 [Austropuccinia psidii MF-1]|uniref:Uncharacterized protein n=1 Tax=Austropuccinia psidii MF-1 TaxID=1389203 RepID=A0A9Q3ID30_9BASI|nr:hypothetical protein [Austropuccinia psidii MF-1]
MVMYQTLPNNIQNCIHTKLTGPTEDPVAKMIRRELPHTPPSHPSPLNLTIKKDDLLKSHQTKCKTILMIPNNSPNQQYVPYQRTSEAGLTDPSQRRGPEGNTCFFFRWLTPHTTERWGSGHAGQHRERVNNLHRERHINNKLSN